MNKMFPKVKYMTTAVLLSDAFSQYDLEIPRDVCDVVNGYLENDVQLRCRHCYIDLLNVFITKPFVKNVPTSWKVFHGNVFTPHGMLSRTFSNIRSKPDMYLDSLEGVLKPGRTPDTIEVCGICVKNEIKTYDFSAWYKCLYSEHEHKFIYLCSHCFLFNRRKLRRLFTMWKHLRN